MHPADALKVVLVYTEGRCKRVHVYYPPPLAIIEGVALRDGLPVVAEADQPLATTSGERWFYLRHVSADVVAHYYVEQTILPVAAPLQCRVCGAGADLLYVSRSQAPAAALPTPWERRCWTCYERTVPSSALVGCYLSADEMFGTLPRCEAGVLRFGGIVRAHPLVLRTHDGATRSSAFTERLAALGLDFELDREVTPHLIELWRYTRPMRRATDANVRGACDAPAAAGASGR